MSELTDALDKKGQDMEALHRCTKILSHPILSYPLSYPILSYIPSLSQGHGAGGARRAHGGATAPGAAQLGGAGGQRGGRPAGVIIEGGESTDRS